MRTNHDLLSLELRWPEAQDMKRRLYLFLDATTTGPAHGLVKTMVVVGFVSRFKLSQEYDTMRGMDRTVASQRIMNPEASQTKEQSKLQLPICEATVDECETRYQVGHHQQDDGFEDPHQSEGHRRNAH